MSYYIGIIGNLFLNNDRNKLKDLLINAINESISVKNLYEDKDNDENIYIVIGAINKGVNKFALSIAKEKKWKVICIDSDESKIYDLIKDVDRYIFIEGKFGIENKCFIQNIDILINIDGKSNRDYEKVKLMKKVNKPIIGVVMNDNKF